MDRKKYFKTERVLGKAKLPSIDRKKLIAFTKKAAYQLAVGALAFFAQRVALADAVYPLGISMLIGIGQNGSLAAAIGFILGCIFSKTAQSTVYISTAAVIIAVRFLLAQRGKSDKKILLACTVSGTASLLVSRLSAFAVASSLTLSAAVSTVCEALLIALLGLFFHIAFSCAGSPARVREVSPAHRLCIYVSVFCAALALCGMSVGYVSLGRIILFFVCISLLSVPFEFSLGCCAFISAAIVCADSPFYFAASGCCAACCVACLFRRYSKTVYTLAFFVTALACALLAPNAPFGLIYVCELSVAAAAYLFIPTAFLPKFSRRIPRDELSDSTAIASARLSAISLSFGELSALLKKICSVPTKQQSAESLINSAAENVCRDCKNMSACWIESYSDTVEGLGRLVELLVKRRTLAQDDVTSLLHGRCINPISLCGQLNRGYEPLRAAVNRDKNTLVYRSVIQSQFSALSEMLKETEIALCETENADPAIGEKIRKSARSVGIEAYKAQCGRQNERLRIAVHTKKTPTKQQRRALAARVEQLVERRVCESQYTVFSGGACIEYCEQPLFELKTAFRQTNAKSDCGDNFSIFRDCAGNSHIVLADGMGTGYAAAFDSAVCCAFIRRLLENGFDAAAGARLINSVMAIKDESETAVTVDTLCFDAHTGKATLLKAGAAPTFVCKRNGVHLFAHPTLPVGIFDEVCAKSYEITLCEGDVAIMLTDGALSSGGGAITELLRGSRGKTPEQIVSDILYAADGYIGARDDVTVIAAEVVRTD